MASTLERDKETGGKKRKYTTTFTPEDRAVIGRYAAENGKSSSCQEVQGDPQHWREYRVIV